MAELKTKENEASVEDFLNRVTGERKRQDSFSLLEMMQRITGQPPKMWGDSIVGFGSQHYKYATGHEGDMPWVGFSPRKQSLTLYLALYFKNLTDLLPLLGKHKTSKSCLYINKLSDVDQNVLAEMITRSVADLVK
jgi:hypothetical protein